MAICLAILAALAPAAPALAHASFETSDPVDGTVMDRAPSQVSLDFSEEVLVDASSVTLLTLGTERIGERRSQIGILGLQVGKGGLRGA